MMEILFGISRGLEHKHKRIASLSVVVLVVRATVLGLASFMDVVPPPSLTVRRTSKLRGGSEEEGS